MIASENQELGEFTTRRELLGEPETSNYKPYSTTYFKRPRDLPPFTFRTIEAMLLDPTVRLGLAARLAPIMGAEFCYKQNDEWVTGVMANSPVVAAFVMRQLKRIWSQIDVIASNQIWGWSGAELTFELRDHGTVEIKELLPRAASDVKVLVEEGNAVGVQFERIGQASNGEVKVRFPRAIFSAYQPDPGQWYGSSALLGAYSPWADKCFEGGALDVRRLFMHKDAYGGMDVAYPDGRNYEVAGRGIVTSRDIADEIVQQALSGSVTVRPSGNHPDGTPLWDVKRATTPGNPAHILQYPQDLDVEILRGLEVPDDILTAEATGAWAGKTVPMMAFYMSLDRWLAEIIKSIMLVMKPLVELNFGEKAWFQIETKPLAEQMLEQQAKMGSGAQSQGASVGQQNGTGEQYGQQPGQQQPGQRNLNQPGQLGQPGQSNQQQQSPLQRMSADIGRGVISATELVKAARSLLSLDDSGHEHAPAGSGKGGQFVSKGGSSEGETTGKQLLKDRFKKQMKESHNPSQKRAKKGGELGPNNEWYEGGAWIATTDMPKKVKKQIKDASIRKSVIEPGKYGIPEPGKVAILEAMGGTYFNHRDGKVNYQFIEYQRASAELRKQVEEAAEKYNNGERFVDIEQFYEIAKFEDIARLMEAEQPLPGVLVPRAKAIFGADFEKYKPNQKPPSEKLSLDDSGHEHAPAGSPGGGQFVSKSGSESSPSTSSKSDSSKSTSDKSNKLESATKKRQVRQTMASQLPAIKKDAENLSVDQWADIANSVWSFDPEEQLDVERSHVDDLVQIMFNESGKNADYTEALASKISDLSEDDNEVYDLAESAIDNALAKAAQSQAERWAKNLQVDQSTKEQIDEIGRRHFERGGDVASFKTMVGDLLKVDPKRPWLALYANYLDLQDYDSQVETMSLQRAKMELHWKLSLLK